jgi:hypothetical protein
MDSVNVQISFISILYFRVCDAVNDTMTTHIKNFVKGWNPAFNDPTVLNQFGTHGWMSPVLIVTFDEAMKMLEKKPSNSLEVMEQKDYGKTVKLNINQIAIRESIKSLEI